MDADNLTTHDDTSRNLWSVKTQGEHVYVGLILPATGERSKPRELHLNLSAADAGVLSRIFADAAINAGPPKTTSP